MPCTSEKDGAPPLGAPKAGSGGDSKALDGMSDGELLGGLRRSSEAHFAELYGRYFKRIYAFVYSRMRNHADAEEVVQETFTVVFSSVDSYRGQSSLPFVVPGAAMHREMELFVQAGIPVEDV